MAAQEVGPPLPAAVKELGLIDERRTVTHLAAVVASAAASSSARVRAGVGANVDVSAALSIQARELLVLVRLAALAIRSA